MLRNFYFRYDMCGNKLVKYWNIYLLGFFFFVIPENRFVMLGTITALPPKLVNDVGQPHLDTSNKFANIILRRVLFTCIKCH